MSYEIVRYLPEFDARIAELQRLLGNGDAAHHAKCLKWKYVENPYFDQTLIYLALHDGQVVGTRGMLGTLWQADDDASRFLLPYADNLVVAPEHRNRGVVSLIMKAAFDDLARRGHRFAISLSAGPVTYVSSLALGWRSAGSFGPVRRGGRPAPVQSPSRARALARQVHVLRRLVFMLRRQHARTVFQSLDRAGRASRGYISVGDRPRIDAMVDLIARLPWDGRIRHVRDARYLTWRFRNPDAEYRFLFAGGERLDGYLVLQRSISDFWELDRVNIVDCEAADDRVRADLLAAALGWGGFGRVHAWLAGAGDSGRALLREHGFADDPDHLRVRHQGLLVRRLGEPAADPSRATDHRSSADWRLGSRDLLNIEDWDMRMLYSMFG
jgi:GNAT superfamily N-acetyltransferase